MSAFSPESFLEAKSTFRPLKRSQMARQGDSSFSKVKTRQSAACKRKTASESKPKPKKRAKRLTDGKLKKKVWKEFSRFIRTRGADSEGMNDCFTCEVRLHFKQLEAGHLVPGRTNAILFNELSVNPQCRRCNGHFRGNTIVYYPKMVALHGQEAVDQIVAQKDVTHKWSAGELQGLLDHYKNLNASNPLLKKTK